MRSNGVLTGSVVEFDNDRGLGVVHASDESRYPFHCTAIADGTRTIEEGSKVVFTVAAKHLGRLEATDINKV